MFKPVSTFKGFSVNDLSAAQSFYEKMLGLRVSPEGDIGINIHLPDGLAYAYLKDDHTPATYTTLDFVVDNIDEAVDSLREQGVQFERYDNTPQDEKGILRGLTLDMGPDIAWFRDPAGNILAVVQQTV
jgi:catechol 2,3-dioxygenase-like lactoylglutathione lyase family enzyme